jgi:hypothetical protein
MYNEGRERFSLQDVILQIMFIILFVFLLLWLFPTKNFVQKQVQIIDDSAFNQNIITMKESAKEYFTLERLPQKEGDKVRITLGEMLGKKFLLPFSDEGSSSCDLTKSYVEVTKLKTEWEMKVNLDCGVKSDYIISIMGCYDYCLTTLCVKEDIKPIVPTKIYEYEYKLTTGETCNTWSAWSAWSTNKLTPSATREENTKTENVFSHFEQVSTGKIVRDKLIGRQTFTTVQTNTNSTEYVFISEKTETVKTGTVTIGTGTYTRDAFLGTSKYTTRQTNTTTREFANERITYERTSTTPYATNKYTSRQTSTNSVDFANERITYERTSTTPYATNTYSSRQTSTNTVDFANERISGSTTYTRGSYIGRYDYTKTMANTATREYVYISTRSEFSCDNVCQVVNIYVYDVYNRIANTTSTYTYDLYAKAARYTYDLYAKAARYTYDVYSLKEVTKTEDTTTTVKTYTYDVYSRKTETVQQAVYKDVTYYSYRTKECTGGTVTVKWSRTKTDKTLLNQSYKLTGNYRIVK